MAPGLASMIVVQNIRNPHGAPLTVRLEPWGEEYSVPPGAVLVLRFEGPATEPSFDITWARDQVTFGCAWAGAQCSLSVDGQIIAPN
jgi:hypothetical protein